MSTHHNSSAPGPSLSQSPELFWGPWCQLSRTCSPCPPPNINRRSQDEHFFPSVEWWVGLGWGELWPNTAWQHVLRSVPWPPTFRRSSKALRSSRVIPAKAPYHGCKYSTWSGPWTELQQTFEWNEMFEKVKVYTHKIIWHYKSCEWFMQILLLLNKLKCSKKAKVLVV